MLQVSSFQAPLSIVTPKYIKGFLRTIKPGGYVESQEFDLQVMCDDDSLPKDSAIVEWCKLLNEGGVAGGMRFRLTSDELKSAMEIAGFEDIKVLGFKLPIGLWPADPKLREAGKFTLGGMLVGLQGVSLAIFTRLLGWDVSRMEILLAQVRAEWKKKSIHSYWPM